MAKGGVWKNRLIGDYNWKFLCIPTPPWKHDRPLPPFFGKDDKLSLLVATVMGLQHALAMVGGIITAPLLIAMTGFQPENQAYLVSAALIVAAIASLVQVMQIKVPGTRFVIGSGLLSVMGVSFSFVPVAQQVIGTLSHCSCAGTPCIVGGTCVGCAGPLVGKCHTPEEAYGKVLGTIMVCAFYQMTISFVPSKVLRRVFPPVVTGTCLVLLGTALIGSGFQNWGGGIYCGSQVLTTKVPCSGNGEVVLAFGHRVYLGLGLVVFFGIIFSEMFGSPFIRNTEVIIGLFVGMIVASSTHYTSCDDAGVCKSLRYVTGKQISEAKWVTFLWVRRFPLGFYAPAVLPILFAYMVTTMECIGDITATTEASHLEPVGEKFERRIQGAVLADGINSFFGALGTITPVTTYAQNNGVISLSRCASRYAGYACCAWLFILGVFGKFSAIILTIPNCVLGGMTTFLFTGVVVSGIHVLNLREGLNRRNRFIAIMAVGVGMGVTLVPAWVNITGQSGYPFEGNFWPVNPAWSPGFRGFRDSLIIVLSNGFSIGGFIAVFLNIILPFDQNDSHAGFDGEDNVIDKEDKSIVAP